MMTPARFRDFDKKITSIETEFYPKTASGIDGSQVVTPLLKAMVGCADSPLAHLWSVNPREGRLLLTTHQLREPTTSYDPSTPVVLDASTSLVGKSVESRRCEFFTQTDLCRVGKRQFAIPSLIKDFKICEFLAIPISNIGNPHQTIFTISWFFSSHLDDAEIGYLKAKMQSHSRFLADAIESNLRERCYRASLAVSQRVGILWEGNPSEKATAPTPSRSALYETFATTVNSLVECNDITIYVEDWDSSKLVPVARTNGKKAEKVPDHCPPAIIESWRTNRESSLTCEDAVQAEILSTDEPSIEWQSCIIIPLHNVGGRCRGVIRCIRCRPQSEGRHLLHYEDVAVVQAMEQAFGSPLEMLLAAEERDVSLQKLSHELRVPITAMKAIIRTLERECSARDFAFRFPHFEEATRYIDLMNRQLKELDFVRKGASAAHLIAQETRLSNEVIAPAIRFIAPILRQYGFTPLQLTSRGFQSLPNVSIDAGFITQVLFNLIENAIKYFPDERAKHEFKCVVEGRQDGGCVEISVSDNGAAIPVDERRRIFQKGFRGKAASRDPGSSGLGLWVSRAVVERHTGSSLVLDDNTVDGNRFVMRFPICKPSYPSMSNVPLLSSKGQ